MKKYLFIIMAISAVAFISCQKDNGLTEIPDNNEGEIETVSVVVNDDLKTKGDYAINGSDAIFSWSSGDQFYRVVRSTNGSYANNYGDYNHFSFTYSSGTGKSATFSGNSISGNYEDSEFALFPANITADFGYSSYPVSGSAYGFYLILKETIPFDPAHPLKNIVPMFGEKSGSTYTFKPVTGVLAITLNNIPAAANKVTLSTTNGGLSGKTVRFDDSNNSKTVNYKTTIKNFLGESSNGLRQGWITGTSKTYSFDAGSLSVSPYNNTATFYFPIASSYASDGSASPYTNFTIEVKEGDSVLKTIAVSGISFSIERAQIVGLPPINCDYVGTSITANVTGDPAAIKAYYSKAKGTVTHVRAAALPANSRAALDAAITSNSSGTDIFAADDSESAILVASGFSTSGKYYIGIKAYNGATEVGAYIIKTPVYYLNETDRAALIGKFTGSSTITFAVSDNINTSNVMISEFDGVYATINVYGTFDGTTFKANPEQWKASRFGKDSENRDLMLASGSFNDDDVNYYYVANASRDLEFSLSETTLTSARRIGTAFYSGGYYYYTSRRWGTFTASK